MIKRKIGTPLLVLAVFFAGTLAFAQEEAKKSGSGRVLVEVKYLNPGESNPSFEVKMYSQVINLRWYDLSDLAQLKDDRGVTYAAGKWESSVVSKTDHYGVLSFSGVDLNDRKAITLGIRGVGRADERVFTWQLK